MALFSSLGVPLQGPPRWGAQRQVVPRVAQLSAPCPRPRAGLGWARLPSGFWLGFGLALARFYVGFWLDLAWLGCGWLRLDLASGLIWLDSGFGLIWLSAWILHFRFVLLGFVSISRLS